jgi:hypothetical protein
MPGGTERNLAGGGLLKSHCGRKRIEGADRDGHVLRITTRQVHAKVAALLAQIVATTDAELTTAARQATGHPDAIALAKRAWLARRPAARTSLKRPPQGCDLARELAAQDMGKADRDPRGARPNIDIDMVHPGGAYAHQRFAGPGDGGLCFFADQHVGAAVLVKPADFHAYPVGDWPCASMARP